MWRSEDFLDAVQETLNVGVGQAARSLSEMVGSDSEIELTVPKVTLSKVDELCYQDGCNTDMISCVKQSFEGAINGSSFLVFSQRASLEPVRLILGNETPADKISSLESEALCEIGNIILNASLSSFAQLLEQELITHVPKVLSGEWGDIFFQTQHTNQDRESQRVLCMNVSFRLEQADLTGQLGFALDTKSTETLGHAIHSLLGNI